MTVLTVSFNTFHLSTLFFSITDMQSTVVASGALDASHPHYLHPSDSPGMMLVHSLFDGKGFAGWKRAILSLLFLPKTS